MLHVGSLIQREFRDSDAELLQLVGDRVALEDRALAAGGSGPDRADASARPQPRADSATPGAEDGGTLHPRSDRVRRRRGLVRRDPAGTPALGLAIGDIAGHGMPAATYMGQLRSALRAYALDVEAPGEVLRKLARFAEAEHSRMATLIYGT